MGSGVLIGNDVLLFAIFPLIIITKNLSLYTQTDRWILIRDIVFYAFILFIGEYLENPYIDWTYGLLMLAIGFFYYIL